MADVERDARWAELQRLQQQGDWQGALAACARRHDPLLLWLRPTLDALAFLGEAARRHAVRHVVSVGCGSGLFEWLLASATGLRVSGLEVNREWWESRYSPPTFLPLLFPDEEAGAEAEGGNHAAVQTALGDKDSCIMFCYFNDTTVFLEYLRAFRGRLLFVAGPEGHPEPCAGAGREAAMRKRHAHCHPEPLSADIPTPWRLEAYASIGSSGDAVAVYTR